MLMKKDEIGGKIILKYFSILSQNHCIPPRNVAFSHKSIYLSQVRCHIEFNTKNKDDKEALRERLSLYNGTHCIKALDRVIHNFAFSHKTIVFPL